MNKWPTAIFGASPDYSFDVEYFPVEVPDFHAAKSPINRVRAAGNVLWARKVSSSLEKVLNEFKPDIVHLHSYAHQLSPSIIGLLRKQNVPTVMTSHDYKLICPSYTAVRDGHDCFDCAVRLSLLPIKAR
ncbi:MAG: glycosyltransferase, partial [Nitrososphaerales archaeon]